MRAVLKVNPSRLPVPPLPPTREIRIKEKVDIPFEVRDWASNYKSDMQKMDERRKRAHESRARTMENGYTPEQEEMLISLYKKGLSWDAIAEKMGRTKAATRQKVASLQKKRSFNREAPLQRSYNHHKPESDIVRRNHYTPAQDAVIKEMRSHGKTYREIGNEIGKSSEAVRRRWYLLAGMM